MTQDLADDLASGLSGVTKKYDEATSFHVSFGIVQAGTKSDRGIQAKVIAALKKYGGYHPLHSSDMEISAVALLESAHQDDATRYTTYLEEPLGGGSLAAALAAGTVYSAPNMALAMASRGASPPATGRSSDEVTQADVEALLDWVERRTPWPWSAPIRPFPTRAG